MTTNKLNTEYNIALSFAGENRNYVEQVAYYLLKNGYKVFYDKYDKISLWGKNLYTHLQDIYYNKSKYTIIFISKYYKDKLWTNHERESAQARAFKENYEYILPVRFDETEIPGVLPTIGYIDLKDVSPLALSEMIIKKIGPIKRYNFLPEEPDLIFKEIKSDKYKSKEEGYEIVKHLFNNLLLMKPIERIILFELVTNSCPCGIPDEAHISIDFLSRIVNIDREELLNIIKNLNLTLNEFKFLIKHDKIKPTESINHYRDGLFLTYESLSPDIEGNITYILFALFNTIINNFCEDCCKMILETLDLSFLNSKIESFDYHKN